MLELRTYTRAELEVIFHTDRTDSFRRSLSRAGYTFESGGRGQGYWIKITGLPEPPSEFKLFAKREFAAGPQTDFETMQKFLFLLSYHEEYRYYPATYQAIFLKEVYNIEITDQTLRNWKKKLTELNWIAIDTDDVKYYACRKGEKPSGMESENYKAAWRQFYDRVSKGEDADVVRGSIYHQNEGMPRRQFGFAENGIELKKLQELRKKIIVRRLNCQKPRQELIVPPPDAETSALLRNLNGV